MYQSSNSSRYNILKIATSNPLEYYLIENRQYTGFDTSLYKSWSASDYYNSTGGMVVWHIDEQMINAYPSGVNAYGHAPGVMPVYIGNNVLQPFRLSTNSGSLFNWATDDFADLYTTTPFGRQLAVANASSTITIGVTNNTILPATRLGGADRFATAVAISQNAWSSATNVVLASGTSFPDALAATPLAAALDAPILLVDSTGSLPAATLTEINRLGAQNVYIAGGTSVVSQATANTLQARGKNVTRFSGSTRYDTAQVIANYLYSISTYDTVVLASGTTFPDGLSAGAGAGASGYPIVYATVDQIPAQTQAILNKSGVSKVIIVGGNSVIGTGIENTLRGDYTVTRLAGDTRYETNAVVQDYFFPSATMAYVATGVDFPDALSAGAAAAKSGAPIVLAPETATYLSTATTFYIRNADIQSLKLAGETGVLSHQVERYLRTVE